MAKLQINSNLLVSGNSAQSGTATVINTTLQNTIYYYFSGSGNATLAVEASDVAGNWGYFIDTITLSGSSGAPNQSIKTFITPIGNSIRGDIRSISANCQGMILLDSSY